MCDANTLEDICHPPTDLPIRNRQNPLCEGNIFKGSFGGKQLEILKNDANRASKLRNPTPSQTCDIATVDDDIAAIRPFRRIQQSQQRRLAGAAWARKDSELTGIDLKGDILKSLGIGCKALEDMEHLDHEATGGVIAPRR